MRIVIEVEDDQVETAIEREDWSVAPPRREPCALAHYTDLELESYAVDVADYAWRQVFLKASTSDSQANNILRLVNQSYREPFLRAAEEYARKGGE